MKQTFKHIKVGLVLTMVLSSCNDFLERAPESMLTAENYFTSADNLDSYTIGFYNSLLPVHGPYGYGTFQNDADTDNMASVSPNDIFCPGYVKVPEVGGAYDSFGVTYNLNYFLNIVPELNEAGKITGAQSRIRHAIGEAYFLRAMDYFGKLQNLGDCPIITENLPDDAAVLNENSRRAPRNEVARFILSDLDKAIEHLEESPYGGTNRIGLYCAYLLKARVALYEGTWLKYFKNTGFVPGGPDWPGAMKDYNASYAYPLGDIDAEIDWFLGQAMDASKTVADKYPLTDNRLPSGAVWDAATDGTNPYFDMFANTDMSAYPEVLMWKKYDVNFGTNSIGQWSANSNNGYGTTKSMMDAFVMSNGLPIYAAGSGYPGDSDLKRITENRDGRAVVFVKKPGDVNLVNDPAGPAFKVEPYPDVAAAAESNRYTTGYALRKGMNTDGIQSKVGVSTIGCVIFRAVEAYLIYIEACYEKTGQIDSQADAYWRQIRRRAKVEEDYNITIAATDMNKEAVTDWGAYSAGRLVDATLFNIRRERRCELMAEGFRPMDVRRWRSMDQMIDKPYHVLGINLWENADLGSFSNLREGQNVSKKTFGKYLAPYHILTNNHAYNGYSWNMAHYLSPIALQHFLITGAGVAEDSPLYQNPGWPLAANEAPLY